MTLLKDGKIRMKATTVIFLPSTKGGILLAKMRQNELMMYLLTGFKISYSEAGGIKLGRLFTPNLSKGLPCGRTKCQPCGMSQSGKAQNCKARNILYESSCIICNPEDKVKPTGYTPVCGLIFF